VAYLRDPELIYQQSFSAIRKEADLSHFPQDIANIVVRMIHSCGMTDIAQDIVYTINAASAGKAALIQGSPVLCDSRMVCEGVIRAKLPAENEVLCWNNCPESADLAKNLGPLALRQQLIYGAPNLQEQWLQLETPQPRCFASLKFWKKV